MAHTDLPEWVWDLIDAIADYEDTHPLLYRDSVSGGMKRAECFGHRAGSIIPSEVIDMAAMMRNRNRERDIWIKEQAWDEGFTENSHQHRMQREDPDHPITRANPYTQVPF